MATSFISTLSGNFADNTMPILCNDNFPRSVTVSSDFVFGGTNPACHAGAVLPANAAVLGTMNNAARDDALLLSRTGAVTMAPSDAVNKPTFDTALGMVFAPTTKLPMSVSKVGVAANVICSPQAEGFIDFLVGVWFRASALPATQGGIFANGFSGGKDWGFLLDNSGAGGRIKEMTANLSITPGAVALNTRYHAAILYRFNVGVDTTSITTFLNGVVVQAAVAGQAPTAYTGATGNRACFIGGGNGYATMTGAVARVTRDYVGASGLNDAQVAALVAREYAAGVLLGV